MKIAQLVITVVEVEQPLLDSAQQDTIALEKQVRQLLLIQLQEMYVQLDTIVPQELINQ